MNKKITLILKSSTTKYISTDVHWNTHLPDAAKPVVIFSHGFKGFKDWGAWDLVAEKFAESSMVFIKFNFSHNGTTLDDPLNFGDLDAFGNNNFTRELNDLGGVIDWVQTKMQASLTIPPDLEKIYLIGHSRGGGITLLKAAEDRRVKKIALWASVSNLLRNPSETFVANWKKEGVTYILNGRTKQNMPLYWQLYEDFQSNAARLDVETAARRLEVPVLIAHGTNDPAVPVSDAKNLNKWCKNARLLLIENANHVFGARHPFVNDELPPDAAQLVSESIRFFNE